MLKWLKWDDIPCVSFLGQNRLNHRASGLFFIERQWQSPSLNARKLNQEANTEPLTGKRRHIHITFHHSWASLEVCYLLNCDLAAPTRRIELKNGGNFRNFVSRCYYGIFLKLAICCCLKWWNVYGYV